MIKRILFAAAVVMPLVPALAAAQSAMPNPGVPGSGYQIPEVHTTNAPMTSAEVVDPSVPGDGYQIQRAGSSTAPSAPVTNDNGSYPSHWLQQ